MKVYIQFDFEGIAGFAIRDNQDRNIPVVRERIARMRKIANAEVSAAADACFAEGADEVVVWDSHGNGNTLMIEDLSEGIQLITGEYGKGPWLPFFDNVDIGVYIGGHAMEGTPCATLPHTKVNINGDDYGEVGMFINCCGSQNIPVVAVSGDLALKKEVARQSPQCEFAVVKEALGPTLIKSFTPKRSCQMIYDAVKKGVKNVDQIKPFKIAPPFVFSSNFETYSAEKFVYDANADICSAYHLYLKKHCNYATGWPEYNLP